MTVDLVYDGLVVHEHPYLVDSVSTGKLKTADERSVFRGLNTLRANSAGERRYFAITRVAQDYANRRLPELFPGGSMPLFMTPPSVFNKYLPLFTPDGGICLGIEPPFAWLSD